MQSYIYYEATLSDKVTLIVSQCAYQIISKHPVYFYAKQEVLIIVDLACSI
jgi:hypothetical protein